MFDIFRTQPLINAPCNLFPCTLATDMNRQLIHLTCKCLTCWLIRPRINPESMFPLQYCVQRISHLQHTWQPSNVSMKGITSCMNKVINVSFADSISWPCYCKQCLDVGVGPILMRFIMCVCVCFFYHYLNSLLKPNPNNFTVPCAAKLTLQHCIIGLHWDYHRAYHLHVQLNTM